MTTPILNNGQNITYFANKTDADANENSIGASSSYVVGTGAGNSVILGDSNAANPYFYWAVSTSSVGNSISAWKNGGTLDSTLPDGAGDPAVNSAAYLLYPINIVYFNNAFDASQSSGVAGWNTDTYTVGDISDGGLPAAPNNWVIIPWSTGTDSQTTTYTNTTDLTAVGTYGLYPYDPTADLYPHLNESCLTYFANKADADANQNGIGGTNTNTYTVGAGQGNPAILDDLNSLNPYVFWGNSTSSIGVSPPSIYKVGYDLSGNDGTYDSGLQINLSGLSSSYLLYPIKIVYFSNLSEALVIQVNAICWNYDNYTVGTVSAGNYPAGVDKWKIAPNSTGTSSQSGFYNTGDTLNDAGTYILYPYASSIACFLEGTNILCQIDGQDSYIPIQTMKPGTLVKTPLSGYKKVEVIGKRIIENPNHADRIEERLYKCSPNKYPELQKDLYITGCHSILVNNITEEQRAKTIKSQGRVFVTDKKYRLMAVLDEKAEPWVSGDKYTIWHFALEHPDLRMNYGVYANGLLVESSSIRYMKNYSKMELIK